MGENLLWVIGVLIIGVALVGVLLYFFKPKPPLKAPKVEVSLEELKRILKDRSKTFEEIERATGLFLEDFGRLSPSKEARLEVLYLVVIHPKVSSKLVLSFEKELKAKNPEDSKEIEAVLKGALDSRK